jgi:2-phosphosulfolactate phosphatase
MKVTLNLEKSDSKDVSIMVDVLRASTTITVALDKFQQVIPVVDHQEAIQVASKLGAIIAGERRGATLDGFHAGNSPIEIQNFEGETLVLTTSNGTRIMENMDSKVLVGCFTNAKAVAHAAQQIAKNHIEIVMAGVEGRFAIEDFLGAGAIISHLQNQEVDEFAQSAALAVENISKAEQAILNSRSSRRLNQLGFEEDVKFCLKRDTSNNVPIFKEDIITKYYPEIH